MLKVIWNCVHREGQQTCKYRSTYIQEIFLWTFGTTSGTICPK